MHWQYKSCIHAVYTISAMVLTDNSSLGALADSPDYDDPFSARLAEQVARTLSDIVRNMCAATGAQSHENHTSDNLNERTVVYN